MRCTLIITVALGFALGALADAPVYLLPTNPPAKAALAWDASPSTNVTGYNIYYGPVSRGYTNKVDAGDALTCQVSNLVRGATYYFAATAYTADGLESDFSDEVFGTMPLPPAPPSNLTQTVVRMTVESASTPTGPWTLFAELGTEASAPSPAFYRGVMRLDPPRLAAVPQATRPATVLDFVDWLTRTPPAVPGETSAAH